VILLDIYPAREEPIAGVSSEIVFNKIRSARKMLCGKEELLDWLRDAPVEVLVTFGAGDISEMLPDIERLLRGKYGDGM